MYIAEIDYWINSSTRYKIVAKCKNIVGYDIEGFSFTAYNDADEVIRLKYDKEIFDDIEHEAYEELLEQYYHPNAYFGAH